MEDHGSGRRSRSGSGLDLSSRRRVDLELERCRKRHWHVRARVMLSGGDIFTGDSSLPDESNDRWIKANGAAKRRWQKVESTALPETNRARGGALV